MKLSELIKTTELRIPTEDGAEVVIRLKQELAWFDQLALIEIKDDAEQGRFLALKLIDSWNLTTDSGSVLPITQEVLEKLPAAVMLPLTAKIVEMAKESEVKKKTSQNA